MLRSLPPDRDPLNGARALPVSFNSRGTPSGQAAGADSNLMAARGFNSRTGQIENQAASMAAEPDGADMRGEGGGGGGNEVDFLALVRQAEDQASLYVAQVNRKAWSQSYRALNNEHYVGSKYTRPDWRGRSRLFVPKTRTAMRKDNAAVAASLFNNIDAITCMPGNESDPKQRASAAIMQELVNYRTKSGANEKAGFPWFLIAMGARQDAMATGICVTKQYWLREFRKTHEETVVTTGPDGTASQKIRDVFVQEMNRPDIASIPPENIMIDPAASWLNPAQKSAFFIIKWPMTVEEIKKKQQSPIDPWNDVSEEVLKTSVESGKWDMASIRRARELGLDRLDETQTGTHFQVVWVYEVFLRVDGDDYTFRSIGDQTYLTDPKPTRDVYPEQFGERPIAYGYGALQSHRIYPMAPVESWQPLQLETNDLRNLMLDGTKQNVMPITKIRRGRQIDLDQVRRRSAGSAIIVQDADDVTFETAPQIAETGVAMSRELDLELDDLAGQQNYGSVETNNALGKTLGGLKLAAGAANAVQEFDIRVWLETWAQPALAQIVRLEQYYESDPIVLGIVGQKAQLFQKFGISTIDDALLENDTNVKVSVGLGAGDPMQRLQKFQSAASIVAPLLAQTKEFQTGEVELDWQALADEVFGAVGYHDGGKRFFKVNPGPAQNPMMDLKTQELQAKIAKDDRVGKGALFQGLASLAKVALGKRDLEASVVDNLLGRQHEATRMGFEHGDAHNQTHLSALDHGHRHGLAIAGHRHQVGMDHRAAQRDDMAAQQQAAGGDAEPEGAPSNSPGPSSSAGPQAPPSASPPPQPQSRGNDLTSLLQSGQVRFTRGADGRISGFAPVRQGGGGSPFPLPPGAQQQMAPAAAPPPQQASAPQPVAIPPQVAQSPMPVPQAPPPRDPVLDEVLKKLTAVAERLSKPKRVVRDKDNRIVGVA